MTPKPSPSMTGSGYVYYRCRAAGTDDTVYVHQLAAILGGADPREVFDPTREVHHESGIPWDNRPSNLSVEEREDHARITVQERERRRRERSA